MEYPNFDQFDDLKTRNGRLYDKVCEIIDWINNQATVADIKIVEANPDDYEVLKLKPGVQITKNGTFYIPGKGFIKKEEAYTR